MSLTVAEGRVVGVDDKLGRPIVSTYFGRYILSESPRVMPVGIGVLISFSDDDDGGFASFLQVLEGEICDV